MEAYFNSQKIEIFPISTSRQHFSYAHVITEDHLLNLIRSVAPSKSFVLSDTYSSTSPFEFVINGYYISLNGTNGEPLQFDITGNDVYAHIFIDTSSPTHPHLWGSDQNGKFSGVTFSATLGEVVAPTDKVEKHSLHILTKEDGNFVIPLASRKCVDGGEIE